jgi:hypothetical protein
VVRPAPRLGADRPNPCSCRPALVEVPHEGENRQWLFSRCNPPKAQPPLLIGKWLLFADCDEVIGDWRIVVQAVDDERLWQAKISHTASANGQLICVYTPSFEDRVDVEAIVRQLHNLGLIRRPISYKPDVFTHALIYRRGESSVYSYLPNAWTMKATPGLDRARE